MRRPALPIDEEARLEALRAYEILDTSSDAAFDALTRLAAHVLNTPIALVSLVDERRQWFKSRVGLEVEETPRDISFCAHAVEASAPLVVRDALEDERFADNPLVAEGLRIRFYVGMPLRTRDGHVLGTLCVIDRAPREPTHEQLQMLELIAGQVVELLEANRQRRELSIARRRAEESATQLEVLFDAMAEGVVVQSAAGSITLANASAERILGLSLEQLTGRTSIDPRRESIREDESPFPGDDHPAMLALRTGQAQRNAIMGVRKPSGALTWISINALPQRSFGAATVTSVISTFRDITLLRDAQKSTERLARQERLVTTGTLAAGVGHEINNPLSFVLAGLELAIEEVRAIAGGSPSGRLRELATTLHEAREGAERIRKIVRGLRSLAREEEQPVPTSVDDALEIALNMSAHEVRHRAIVVRELQPTPLVLADESRLTQLFVNLLVNAGQALQGETPESGRITVKSSLRSDGRVSVAIADNGPGMPDDLQRRIFDPFFTTKPVGVGTGLGLSISHGIVSALGGELQVASTPGLGSTFTVLLPVAAEAPPELAVVPTATSVPRSRVLVVDDEKSVLRIFERVLGKEHEVVTCDDSREALKLIEAGETFDVVFCDLMLPHLRGDALFHKVFRLNPALADRFVFISGGVTLPELEEFLATVPNERIDKPFSVQNLRGMVRRYAVAAVR